MKIELKTDKIIVYLYQYNLNFDDINILNNDIKEILVKLIKRYHINFFGYSRVSIYNNDKYGNILEIEKVFDSSEYNFGTIDLKIVVYKNVPMYFEFDDYCLNKVPKGLQKGKNKYYLNLNDIENIIEYIEYGRINYENNS